MNRKICIVSGATSGLGKAVAKGLSSNGADVVLLYRSAEKVKKCMTELQPNAKGELLPMYCDLSEQKSIREFVATFKKKFIQLDALCNIAGLISLKEAKTKEGIELTWATDYLSHFLLTNLLSDILSSSSPSSVVTISGSAHRNTIINIENPELLGCYNGIRAAKQAALARVMFTYELSRRFSGSGVSANSFCSGFTRTNLTSGLGFPLNALGKIAMLFAHSPEKGAAIAIKLALEPTFSNGKYYEGLIEKKSSDYSYNEDVSARLWEKSKSMTGI